MSQFFRTVMNWWNIKNLFFLDLFMQTNNSCCYFYELCKRDTVKNKSSALLIYLLFVSSKAVANCCHIKTFITILVGGPEINV